MNTVNKSLKNNKSDPSQHVSPENWIEHFKSLLNMDYTYNFSRDNIFNFYALNKEIYLKNGNSSGLYGISNEMLKISSQFFIEEFAFMFNLILKSGCYPNVWRESIINPIIREEEHKTLQISEV